MENGAKKWGFQGKQGLDIASATIVRGYFNLLMGNINQDNSSVVVPLGLPLLLKMSLLMLYDRLSIIVMLPLLVFFPQGDYLNRDLSYKLTPDDVYLTIGCNQAIEVVTIVLSRPGANILLPRPGYPHNEACCAYNHLEMRHYDLLPEKGWEVDVDAVETVADENTAAMVIINPGNPNGNVFSYEHLNKVAETTRKLGILVIADEAYDNLTFGSTPCVPMRVFGLTVPILTMGSISKRWIVAGWRLWWLVTSDPNGILQKSGICGNRFDHRIPQYLIRSRYIYPGLIICNLRECADICYNRIQEIPSLTCPRKPEGSMFIMERELFDV
ncbi:tyrosine aminotransferase-like [Gossypium australe]|uniref:Tyrosine aminotransferase-like n=1 Tax=Gossypium australe TaxID=47621 RepID=A0A5B6WM27_9ROSI|nr:tyrosine aminotransferase-like [Gossypium australe]